MSKEENNPLNIIEEANTKTLEYFNKTYMSNLELVQSLKTELFELEVQIDTLEKTRELYTYQVDDRKNVFSPLSTMSDSSNTKGYQLALQIKDLEDAKESLIKKIESLEQDIAFFKEQVSMLSKAQKCIHTVLVGSSKEIEETDNSDELIEFIAEKDEKLLEMFLEDKYDYNLWLEKIKDLFLKAEIYPCVFGSALYNENVDVLLEILDKLSETNYKENDDFLAKVYKIKTEDNRNKLTFVKILSGKLKLKDEVSSMENNQLNF